MNSQQDLDRLLADELRLVRRAVRRQRALKPSGRTTLASPPRNRLAAQALDAQRRRDAALG